MKHLGSWMRVGSGFCIGHVLTSIGYGILTWQFWGILVCIFVIVASIIFDQEIANENKNSI